MKPTVWIGLVGVFDESENKILDGAPGAYVNVLALAPSAKDYANQAKAALRSVGLRVFEIEEVDVFSQRSDQFALAPKIFTELPKGRRT